MPTIDDLLHGKQVVAVVCNQWGDTGKGKFVDWFSEWADVIVRGTGGNNAGHTIVTGDEKFAFNLIPSGIVHDSEGKLNVIGNGVVLNPAILTREMDALDARGKTYNGLRISGCAHLITPDEMILEAALEEAKEKPIGTTMRAIGPTYASKAYRTGVRVNDMFDRDHFARAYTDKFTQNISTALNACGIPTSRIEEIIRSEKFRQRSGIRLERLDPDDIIEIYMHFAEKLRQFATNTQHLVAEALRNGKKVLGEGAQGAMLDIDHGTYPFVTSSNCTGAGLASGMGIPPTAIDFLVGVAKMFYKTRVGRGPFPTEEGNEDAYKHLTRETEAAQHPLEECREKALAGDSLEMGRYLRIAGDEYGTTTGRPRRTGWLDLVVLRYAIGLNGPNVISTKTDVCDQLPEIRICNAYRYTGPETANGSETLIPGDIIRVFPQDYRILEHCKPVYETFPGWMCDTSGIRDVKDLPPEKAALFKKVEQDTGCRILIHSVGPKREQTIISKVA